MMRNGSERRRVFSARRVIQAGRRWTNRLFLEAVLWIARVGAPWCDLPYPFGNLNSAFKRFQRWAQKGVFEELFKLLSGDKDFEYAMIDGTIIRVYQHGAGAS
jgi:transposase